MRVRLIVGFVALSLASACTGSGGDVGGSGEEPPVTVMSNVDTATMTLPLDAYTVTPAEFQTINNARQRLVRECVRRFGFELNQSESSTPADHRPVKHNDQWGMTDEARAQRYGYNAAPEEWPQVERDAQISRQGERNRPPMSAALVAVLGMVAPDGAPPIDIPGTNGQPLPSQVNGQAIPQGGCFGEADRALRDGTGTPDLDLNYPSELASEAESRTWADSRVVAALEGWRACMRQAGGYSYPTPIEASVDPKWRSQDHTTPASAQEKTVAVADARCNTQVGLSDTAAAVDAAYHHEAIENNSQRLAGFRDATDRVVRNATALLAR